MDHTKQTLCEKIAEGFVISFLIVLLVVPCDLFQTLMWADPVTQTGQVYAFDYPGSDADEPDGEVQPSNADPTKGSKKSPNRTRKAQNNPVNNLPAEIPINADQVNPNSAVQESEIYVSGDSLKVIPVDTVSIVQSPEVKLAMDSLKAVTGDSISNSFVADSLKNVDPLKRFNVWVPRELDFNPDPTRAVWLSALFPGLGQIYNRRYWKLPIVVGAYMGLAYATSWNNTMLGDYTRAYRDIMDTDPSTNSYMDFFPPTVDEASLDKTWLKNILYSRKNYFRRYRDLCIILMVGVYLLAMVDAYVDASLAHFDISQDLSVDWSPALFHDGFANWPSVGVSWAFNF